MTKEEAEKLAKIFECVFVFMKEEANIKVDKSSSSERATSFIPSTQEGLM